MAKGEHAAWLRHELDELAALEGNWDSYGGVPPSRDALGVAHRFIHAVEQRFDPAVGERVHPYDVAPIPRGGVQIEWRGSDVHLEVEIDQEGDVSYLLKTIKPTGREYE